MAEKNCENCANEFCAFMPPNGKAYCDRWRSNAPAVNRWIPCSERLPEAGTSVLIYACKHRVMAYYDNCKNLFRLTENDNLYYIAEYVTHWMPLPEPPESEAQHEST